MKSNATVLMAVDAVLAIAALFLTVEVRLEAGTKFSEPSTLYTTAVLVVVVLFSSHLMEVYDLGKNSKKREIVINILFGAVTSFSLLSVIFYFYSGVMLGHGVLVISITLFALFQFCVHALFIAGRSNHHFTQRVLVLGTGELAARIGELISIDIKNFDLAGYVSCRICSQEDAAGTAQPVVSADKILGSCNELLDIALREQAEVIVVALSERRKIFPLNDVLRCKLNGIQVMEAPSLYELVLDKLMLESITPSWFIFSGGFRRTTKFSICKRAIDVVLSCIGLLITLPFFPLIALAIKLDSPGPVFFRQERFGDREQRFNLYKFRTMRQDAEKGTGAVWAEKNDPRVTRLGQFFRGSRIDEIPQLINVLKGEMSFVGPRPERPEFVEKLKQVIPYYSKRHFIKPGLTGWAQVRYPYGASVEDAVEKLRYDLYYIKNISPFLDALIFFETIKVVLFGYGGR
jgi:sugar transferase (PEP-CTERM system associated)